MHPRSRTASLTGYAELARSVGLDPERLMAQAGLDPADLATPDAWVPAVRVARLLDSSARLSGCPEFGLRLSQLRRLGSLGPISVVLRDEPDLRSALELLIRHERAYNEALHMHLVERDGVVTLEVALELGEPAPTRQALELVMGALVGVIRALVGSEWTSLSACFGHRPPADLRPYHRLFGASVRFDCDFTGLVFAARDLDAPVLISDPSLRPYSHLFLDTLVAPSAPTTTAQAADVVAVLLPLGRCSLEQTSRNLGLSPRMLQQSLAQEGQSYSSIVQAARQQLAERYLSNGRIPLTEVSQRLGFGAPSAFSRWFRQWSGTTPTAWRNAAHAQAPDQAGGTVPAG
jgi:AraC-like DNA-binding protein